MLREVYGNTEVQKTLLNGPQVMPVFPVISFNGVLCEMAECIYYLDEHQCGRPNPPRNTDGYCKDFVSIYD